MDKTDHERSAAMLDRRTLLFAAAMTPLAAGDLGLAAASPKADAIVDAVRRQFGLTGMAAAVLRRGKLVMGVGGRRRADRGDRVQRHTRFMIGSCAKAMTATLLMRLDEQGRLDLDTPLERIWPELCHRMRPAYRKVTLAMLLAHRSGLPESVPDAWLPDILGRPGTPRQVRAHFLPLLLQLEPVGRPGRDFAYSNLGYIVAAAALERRLNASWDDTIEQQLFQPLGMDSAGFGTPTGPLAAWGHDVLGQPVRPSSPRQLPPVLAPAGVVHLDLPDWARFAWLHLGKGPPGYLSANGLARLHRPWPGSGERYALGWGVIGDDPPILTHNGSDDRFWSASILLAPVQQYGLLITTNHAGQKANAAVEAATRALITAFPA